MKILNYSSSLKLFPSESGKAFYPLTNYCPYWIESKKKIDKTPIFHKLYPQKILKVSLQKSILHLHIPCDNQHPGISLIEFILGKNGKRHYLYYPTMTIFDSFFELNKKIWNQSPLYRQVEMNGKSINEVNIYTYSSKNHHSLISYHPKNYYGFLSKKPVLMSQYQLQNSLQEEVNQLFGHCNIINLPQPNIKIDAKGISYSSFMQSKFPARHLAGNYFQKFFGSYSNLTSHTLWATIDTPVCTTDPYQSLGTKNLIYCMGIYIKIKSDDSFRALLHYQPPKIPILKKWFERIFELTNVPASQIQVKLIQNKLALTTHESGESSYDLARTGLRQIESFLDSIGIREVTHEFITTTEFIILKNDELITPTLFQRYIYPYGNALLKNIDCSNEHFDGIKMHINLK